MSMDLFAAGGVGGRYRMFENETVVAIPLDEAWQHDLYIGGNYGI